MKYTATIVDKVASESRVFEDDTEASEEAMEYNWSEGNYGCDCNRSLFFARAAGLSDPTDTPCGHSRYSVAELVLDDGRRIQIDGSP